MRLLIAFILLTSLHAEDIQLPFPGLERPILVSLPENFDPTKKHPAILYYHGTNSKSDTQFIRSKTGQNDWIVVGMTYHQPGRLQLAPEKFAKEIALYHSVRQRLLTDYALDPRKLYASGISKGGWMTDLLLQQEKTLTGGAILAAGHLHKSATPLPRYPFKKPVFIGVGRLDGNYPFSLNALLHHRSLGGNPVMETWRNIGHQYPNRSSAGLRQWFAIQSQPASTLAPIAKEEIDTQITLAKSLNPLARWHYLKDLRELPFTQFSGKETIAEIEAHLATLEQTAAIQKEATALKKHRHLLAKEVKGTTLQSLQEVNLAYLANSDRFKDTHQSKLYQHDHQRTSTLLKHFQAQQKQKEQKEKAAAQPRPPVDPFAR